VTQVARDLSIQQENRPLYKVLNLWCGDMYTIGFLSGPLHLWGAILVWVLIDWGNVHTSFLIGAFDCVRSVGFCTVRSGVCMGFMGVQVCVWVSRCVYGVYGCAGVCMGE